MKLSLPVLLFNLFYFTVYCLLHLYPQVLTVAVILSPLSDRIQSHAHVAVAAAVGAIVVGDEDECPFRLSRRFGPRAFGISRHLHARKTAGHFVGPLGPFVRQDVASGAQGNVAFARGRVDALFFLDVVVGGDGHVFEVVRLPGVVGVLDAVDEGPACERQGALVCVGVLREEARAEAVDVEGEGGVGREVGGRQDHVASFDHCAREVGGELRRLAGYLWSIKGDRGTRTHHKLSLGPRGDAKPQRRLCFRRVVEAKVDLAAPRPVGRLLQDKGLAVDGIGQPGGRVEVDVDMCGAGAVRPKIPQIAAQAAVQATHIRRAAGALEPLFAAARLLGGAGQLVVVCKGAARQVHGRHDDVVERQLEHVGVAAVEVQVQQPLGQHDGADRRTGLGIAAAVVRALRQKVVPPEALPRGDGADAARQVHLFVGHVVPEAGDGLKPAVDVGQCGGGRRGTRRCVVVMLGPGDVVDQQVGHGRQEVDGAHGVALDGRLLQERRVRLVVPVGALDRVRVGPHPGALAARVALDVVVVAAVLAGRVAALLDKIRGQVVRLLAARGPVHAHEGQLNLRVAAVAVALVRVRAKGVVDVPHVLVHGLHQPVVFVVGAVRQRGLDQMAGVVQLVHVSQIGPALARRDHGVVDVEVAVRLLRAADHLDQRLDGGVDLGVVRVGQGVAGRLDPLGAVAVPEQVLGHRPLRRVVVDGVPLQLEGIEAAGALEHRQLRLQGHGADGGAARLEQRRAVELGVPKGRLGVGHGRRWQQKGGVYLVRQNDQNDRIREPGS
ncbi:uncharacterized protein SPSK_05984 [Sporothrix schenckii 1099-18]|uniref:Uncharacterized protein n=1 Tax=Sporothrix schenckii 1099-18 TaxID=1397361 RepID=A0A0F2MLR4_SPOSC|nr:uncharacterized protein SPSK_05984 [Sporothrix schenckii 1099-18]KJR89790.1 hypothetical protein SPSK_05984 [Sporothrix schenckii 1099-18]